MINVDFSDLAQYRSDGRKNDELRQTSVLLGFDSAVDGSCLIRQGLTEVICLVKGPYQRSNVNDNLLKIQYTVAPFSSLEKRKVKYDKQFSQFTQNLRKSFQAVIIDEQYKKSQIQVVVSVLKNQGSAKSAVVNGITLALTQAGIAMKDLIISCTAGTYNGSILIDTNEQQQFQLNNELVISYLNNQKKIDCFDLKKAKIRQEQLKKIYNIVVKGCQELHQRIKKVLIQYCQRKMIVF